MSASPPPSNPESPEPNAPVEGWDELVAQLQTTDLALQELRLRFEQVETSYQHQQYLQQQQQRAKQDLKQANAEQQPDVQQELKHELKRVQQQLDEVELALESRLFSWRSFREPFWQAVRFGGIGVILGWILKSCAG